MPFANGIPAGDPIDVLTGFLDERDGDSRGRLVGVEIALQGALLVARRCRQHDLAGQRPGVGKFALAVFYRKGAVISSNCAATHAVGCVRTLARRGGPKWRLPCYALRMTSTNEPTTGPRAVKTPDRRTAQQNRRPNPKNRTEDAHIGATEDQVSDTAPPSGNVFKDEPKQG